MAKTQKLRKKTNSKDFFDNKLVPWMGKVGNQRHLSSIRDGFAMITPMIIAGAVGILLVTIIFGGWGAGQSSLLGLIARWSGDFEAGADGALTYSASAAEASQIGTTIFAAVNAGTLGSLSIYIPLALGYFLSKTRGFEHPVMAGFVSLAGFLIATGGNSSFFGTSGVFTAILIGIVATEMFVWLCGKRKLLLTLPEGVPPAVANSFSKMFPVIITALFIALISAVIIVPTALTDAKGFEVVEDKDAAGKTLGTFSTNYIDVNGGNGWTIADAIQIGLQGPFLTIASNPSANFGLAMLYVFLVGFFWFFGLHGTNIVNGVFVFWLPLLLKSIDNRAGGVGDFLHVNSDYPAFVAGTFDAFIFLGGTGATLPFIVMALILKRRKDETEVAKFALPAGVFQINEPVVFGVPMVVNPVYFFPYVFAMPILTVSSYLALDIFQAVPPVIVQIPWTIPTGIGGLFATGFAYQGFLLAIANFLIAAVIWTPFIFLSAKLNNRKLLKEGKAIAKREILTLNQKRTALKNATKDASFGNLGRFLVKKKVILGSTLFLGALIIGLSFTWGEGSPAGIAMGTLEGIFIILIAPLMFYGKVIVRSISYFFGMIGKSFKRN